MKTSVDLYPEEYYAYISIRRRLILWSGLFVAVVTSVSMASISLWREVHKAELNLTALEAQVQSMELWGAELAPLVSNLESAQERQRVLGQLVNEPAWNEILNALGAATGDYVWLSEFTVETTSRPNANDAQTVARSIAIQGYAQTEDDYVGFMAALAQSSHVTELDQRYARKSSEFEDVNIVEFELQAKVM
jgi:hypothetical protein